MMADDKFDKPLFKVLSHNDSGQAVGHQAGFVIPKDLEPYFPQLSQNVDAANPTASVDIFATLYDGSNYLSEIRTRYQYQTWGGTRSPERRITGNLTDLRDLSAKDDILLIQRGLDDDNQYRLTLVRKANPNYAALVASFAGKRWGPVDPNSAPVKETLVLKSLEVEAQREAEPFVAFDQSATAIETRALKIARSKAFQRRLVQLYQGRCAFCYQALTRADGRTEGEAAHIIPRSVKGSDDARNGLLLCRAHHWAFDNGLVSVSDDLGILVPKRTLDIPANASLADLAGVAVATPTDASMKAHHEAVRWHRKRHSIP